MMVGPSAAVFAAIARVDDGLYRIERAVVTAAMLLMSGTVCLNIYYQFLTGQRAVWRRMQAGAEDPGSLVPSVALAALLVLLFRAAASAAPALRDMRALHWILGAIGTTAAIALGAGLGFLAVASKNELTLVILGGIFVLETVSVIVQVVSFKLTGKRVFKMAPIHHHFELKGWAEPKVIVRFWIISIMLALVALATLKLR